MYLGDLAHTSSRPSETQITSGNAAQLRPMWKTSVGPVASAVTVSNGFLFFGDWGGNFRSLNAATGSVAWSQFLGVAPSPADPGCMQGVGISAQPVVAGQTVYAGGGDSAVYALDRNTGQIQWRVPLADPQSGAYLWSSLSLYQNALYVGIASLTDCPLVRGGLARIPLDDPIHPQIQYFVPASTLGAGIWSTPAIDTVNNIVYVTTGNAANSVQDAGQGIWGSALLALDATSLQILSNFFLPFDSADTDADWGSSPVLFDSGGQSFVAANGKTGVMYVLNRPSLTPAWSYKLATDCDSPTQGCGSVSTPAFDGNLLITGAGQPDGANAPAGTVYAFDPVKGNLRWMYAARAAVLAPVTLTPGLVFVGTTQGLSILDESTGSELWNDGGTVGLYGQPVVSNGVLYTTYINGDVVAWSLPASGANSALTATPAGLRFLSTSGGASPAAQSIAVTTITPGVNFTVASDSAWLTTDTASAATPATVNVTASPLGMAPGVYSGTLTLAAAGSPVTVTVSLVINPPPPTLAAASIGSAASFQPGFAPGSLFTIFASNLSGATMPTPGAPWPTAWNGISVSINGVSSPLAYVSPTQINAQIAFEVPPGPATVTFQSNGVTSLPVTITVQPSAPAIFVDSTGRAAALNQDSSINSPANPAHVAGYVSIYFTGQGLVNPPVATGAVPPLSPLSYTLATTTATIGGVPVTVTFSGLAPGWIGVAQANLQIPNLPPGDYPVVLYVAGTASSPGVISIAQ